MSALETYAKQVLERKGMEKAYALGSLRRYINLTPVEDLIKYVNMITDQDILRTLIAAGMRGESWRATVSRSETLRKEKAGGET
jgi:hypothetical protein